MKYYHCEIMVEFVKIPFVMDEDGKMMTFFKPNSEPWVYEKGSEVNVYDFLAECEEFRKSLGPSLYEAQDSLVEIRRRQTRFVNSHGS
jgi:hypothetical protein